MAAAAILEKFQMTISPQPVVYTPQRLTIYLYSAHRAVICAIAQLSCFSLNVNHVRPLPAMLSHVVAIELNSN